MPYINNAKLSIPNDEWDDNVWADYIELFCLLKEDRVVNLDYVIDKVKDAIDGDKVAEDMLIEASESNEEEQNSDGINHIFEDNDDFDLKLKKKPEIDDNLKRKIADKFEFVKLRPFTFGDDYPFEIIEDSLKAKAVNEFSSKNKLYITLLISSLLRVVTKSGLFILTHKFETLCGPVFQKLVPNNSYIELIGAGNKSDEELNQLFYEKIKRIAKKLSLHLGGDFTPQYAGLHNVGDGGLDWWGYFPFPDGLNHTPVYFAQCACGRNWIEKQFDTHQSKWKNYLQFKNEPVTIHFIPASFREMNLSWQNPIKISDVVMIDRLRILHLLTDEEVQNRLNDYEDLLNEVLQTKMDFFD